MLPRPLPCRSLPLVRRFSSERAATTGAAIPYAASGVDFLSPAGAARSLNPYNAIKIERLVFDQAFFGHLLVGEPEIGNVRGSQAENVFKCAAHFPELEVYAQPLQQFDEQRARLRPAPVWELLRRGRVGDM